MTPGALTDISLHNKNNMLAFFSFYYAQNTFQHHAGFGLLGGRHPHTD
jgi:hypothetical protein